MVMLPLIDRHLLTPALLHHIKTGHLFGTIAMEPPAIVVLRVVINADNQISFSEYFSDDGGFKQMVADNMPKADL